MPALSGDGGGLVVIDADGLVETGETEDLTVVLAQTVRPQRVPGPLGPDTAIGLVDDAIAIAARAGYRHQYAALLNHLADLNHQAGREREAQTALTQAVTIFADIDSSAWEPEVWLLRQW